MKYRKNAEKYWELWNKRSHIVRIVDTHRLLDSDRVERSITFDIDNSVLKMLASCVNDEEATSLAEDCIAEDSTELQDNAKYSLVIPLLILRKHPIFDVDTVIDGKSPAHLCRRKVNIDVSAHIIVGLAKELGYTGDASALYDLSTYFLGHKRSPSKKEKAEGEKRILKEVSENGIDSFLKRKPLSNLLSLLKDYYIQCVEHPFLVNGVHCKSIIKVRLSDSLISTTDSVANNPNVLNADNSGTSRKLTVREEEPTTTEDTKTDGEASDSLVDVSSGAPAEATNPRKHQRDLYSTAEKFGLRGASIEFNVVHGWANTDSTRHIQFVAPPGTVLTKVKLFEDTSEIDGTKKAGVSESSNNRKKIGVGGHISDDLLINHNDERASLLIRNQNVKQRTVQVLLYPKLANFPIPALFVSVLQFLFSVIAICSGPDAVAHNAAAFTGTAVIGPFITVIFIAKESEHALVGKILSFPRMFLAFSSVVLVVTGMLIAVLPQKHMENLFCLNLGVRGKLCLTQILGENTVSWQRMFAGIGLIGVFFLASASIAMFTYIISSSCAFKRDIKRQVHASMSEVKFDDIEALINPGKKQRSKDNPGKKRHSKGRSLCPILKALVPKLKVLVPILFFMLICVVIINQVWLAWL